MLKANRIGIIGNNIFASLMVIAVLYSYVPSLYLIIWFIVNLFLGATRLYIGNKLNNAILNNNNNDVKSYLKLYILLTSSTALAFGIISWVSISYSTPDINIFIIGIIIIAQTAGAIGTIGVVFISFFGFMFFSIVPFILALIYHGDITFYIFAIILSIYFIIQTLSGYRLFLTYQKSIDLEKKFQIIFDKSSDGIAIIKNNAFIESNETLIDMFGYEKSLFLKTPLSQLSPPTQIDGKSSIRKMLLMLKKAKQNIITFEWLHTKKNGNTFWVEIRLSPITIKQEEVIEGIWRDISDRKKAELEIKNLNTTLESRVKLEVTKNREKDKQLMQQSRLAQMGEMMSMIAHQWRQPLSAISSTSIGIKIKAEFGKLDNDTAIELSEKISKYTQHLSATIDDFREFFKSNKEKKETTYNELVHDVTNIVKDSITNKNIKLIEELNSKEIFSTYPNEIKQVILNLIKNAEDILIEKDTINPQIIIKTFNNTLMVSDNAGGIPEDILDKIFDPYFSTKNKKDGTGLGLYMSKIIIEEHCDGKLSVSNSDEGAVFKIVLENNTILNN